jgi:hypothetical protein
VATVAAILADLLYYIATKAFGEQYILPLDGNGSHIGRMAISTLIPAILIPGFLGTIFFGLLVRFSRKPATIFLSVSTAALILSFGAPFYLPGVSMQTKILLSGMHAIAAGIISGGILLISHTDA